MIQRTLLGVDGGGTKTVAILADVSPGAGVDIIGRGKAESTNVNAVGWDAAASNLKLAVEGAWSDAQREPTTVSFAVLALSGAGHESVKARFVEWAKEEQIAHAAKVIHDAEAVLRAGSPEGWGIALIAGTGSVAFAMDQSENVCVSGGWGFWYGDEGSAFWLGQAALKAVSKATDGRGPSTTLCEAIMDRLEVDAARGILQSLSRDSNVRHNIASLADLVIAQAEDGDQVATEIVMSGSIELARLVQSGAKGLSLPGQFPLALAGGVLTNSALVRETTIRELSEAGISPSSVEVVSEPALGALNLAQSLSSEL